MAEAPWSVFTHGDLHDGARLVVAYLWRTTNHGDVEPFAWVSAARMARELGTDERTIRRRLEAAQTQGLVVRERRVAGGSPRWGWLLVDPGTDARITTTVAANDPGTGARKRRRARTPGPGTSARGETPGPGTDARIATNGNPGTGDARSGHSRPDDMENPGTGAHQKHVQKLIPEAKPPVVPHVDDVDSLPPTKSELEAWQADNPPGFALSSPEPAPIKPPLTAKQRREERGRQAWETYERHRREAWPKARGRQVTEGDVRRVVDLHKHIRTRRGLDDNAAWIELETYGREAIAHALAAEQGATGDSPEWAARLVRWRGDGGEWGTKRYEAWAAGDAVRSSKARRRGHARAEDQDHSEGRF